MAKRRAARKSQAANPVNVAVEQQPLQEGITAEPPASAQPAAPRGRQQSPFKISLVLWLLPLLAFIVITIIKTTMGS